VGIFFYIFLFQFAPEEVNCRLLEGRGLLPRGKQAFTFSSLAIRRVRHRIRWAEQPITIKLYSPIKIKLYPPIKSKNFPTRGKQAFTFSSLAIRRVRHRTRWAEQPIKIKLYSPIKIKLYPPIKI
jgi:hypothetical protein